MPLSRISERMKLEVPLMMPAIHSMRLADRPSRSALMIGTPPATAASNATITPCFCAAAKIWLPWVASSALFAVTTCLPWRIASSTSSFAIVVPPISSTTISTSLPRTTWNASSMTRAFFPTIFLAWATALSATTVMRIARPARRWISSALRLSTSQVPPPTVPMPSRPTLMGFISLQSEMQVALHVGPFIGENAVHHCVPDAAVAPRPVMPDDAVFLRAERLDRALRAEVVVVGAQSDHLALQLFEAVLEEQQLAGGIHMRALAALRVPGVADLDAIGGRDDVVVAGAADDAVGLQVAHHPRKHVAALLALERILDVLLRILRLRHRGKKQLPQLAVLRGFDQTLFMLPRQRLEPDPVPLQRRRLGVDHAAPRNSPSFLNMSRMPRAAWRRRCSFSISAMRTWSSP